MPENDSDLGKHPKGTLALIGLYGLLFAVGWLVVFLFIYLPRGAVTR